MEKKKSILDIFVLIFKKNLNNCSIQLNILKNFLQKFN